MTQRNNDVVPRRVHCTLDVGRRRVGVSVGVRVVHADHLEPRGLRLPVDAQVVPRRDLVDAGGSGHVLRRVAGDDPRLSGNPDEKAAPFVRERLQAVSNHLINYGGRHHEPGTVGPGHAAPTLPWAPVAPRSSRARAAAAAAKKKPTGDRRLAQNRRARHEYEILETFECGIALQGAEVKSLRLGQATLQDAYARVEDGEVWLLGAHIAPYEYATGFGSFAPDRKRKLLLHRQQIDEIAGRLGQQSLTLVPLALYLKEGRVKVELALARGRRLYDKRHAIAARDTAREVAREIKDAARG